MEIAWKRMNDRQKLAALLIRMVGGGWAGLIILGFAMRLVEASLGVPVQEYPTHTILGNVFYIVGGVILVWLAKPLGRLLGKGLE
jgi:hypothetical protein